MADYKNYIAKNRDSWDQRTPIHVNSEFYDVNAFLKGKNTLNSIELGLLMDITGQHILHLQCHFGLDSLSMQRMGAQVTGVDFSAPAIYKARSLAKELNLSATFIESDVYQVPEAFNNQFDIVFTSYGTITWLPDLKKWAEVIRRTLKPGGKLIFVEFHPFVWMFDDEIKNIIYSYFNTKPIVEMADTTYADHNIPLGTECVTWNHSLSEVIQSLLDKKLMIRFFEEYDYSPYDIFPNSNQVEPNKFRLVHLADKIPYVYALVAKKLETGE